jgi:hypothetical protein
MAYRNAEGPFPPTILFRYVDPPQRLCPIASLVQACYRLRFLLRRVPHFSVHARRPFASVLCHPSHGQGFAAERVGQEPLQGFHLAPSPFLYRLHDTRLEPPYVPVDLLPVNAVSSPPLRREAHQLGLPLPSSAFLPPTVCQTLS